MVLLWNYGYVMISYLENIVWKNYVGLYSVIDIIFKVLVGECLFFIFCWLIFMFYKILLNNKDLSDYYW